MCEDVFCEPYTQILPKSICIFLGRRAAPGPSATESKVPPAVIHRAIYFIAIHIILMWRRDGARQPHFIIIYYIRRVRVSVCVCIYLNIIYRGHLCERST